MWGTPQWSRMISTGFWSPRMASAGRETVNRQMSAKDAAKVLLVAGTRRRRRTATTRTAAVGTLAGGTGRFGLAIRFRFGLRFLLIIRIGFGLGRPILASAGTVGASVIRNVPPGAFEL